MDVRQYADLFLTESRDHLTAFNHLLLEWERDPAAQEPVGGIFRAVHTIKGMAATMGYTAVADLSHRVENLLDVLRRGEKAATPATLELLFKSADALDRAIGDAVAGKDDAAPFAALLTQIDREAGAAAQASSPQPRPSVPVMLPGTGAGHGRIVRVALRSEAALKGARSVLAIKKAEALGTVTGVTPAPTAMEAEGFDGRFTFRIESEADTVAIEEAIRTAGDVESVEVAEEVHEAAVEGARGARHIRVDLRRLDELMNQIGELVIARGRLASLTSRLSEPDLDDVALQIGRLAGRLQAEIISARMTPVWQVFDRFPRMVRDLAKQVGKQVAFRVEGKEIELDRTILDELADPLVHLLRNAVDHGIESPEDRLASGKPAVGQLVVSAVRERSTVAIRVTDDGRGVDRAAVLSRAREMGLVGADQQDLGEEDLFRVLTRSGFSTAREVTGVSGRGVGIDVVATAARALGGSLEIRSEEGKGTSFTLRLPVTLAIMRALLARVGTELYALPLTHVAETVDPRPEDIRRVQGRETMMLRGKLLTLVRLGEVLGSGSGPAGAAKLPVIVLEMGERRAGVVVDALVGQLEIVVKNFEAPLGTLPLFSGATILGDGAPALILDAGGLM